MLIIRYIVGAVFLFVFVKGLIELLGRCKDSSYVARRYETAGAR